MATSRCIRRVVWLFFVVALSGNSVFAQEALTVAKVYYASAAYDDALRTLEAARPAVPSPEAVEVAAYRAFCLLALGRTDEARAEVEALVRIDPLYKPGEEQASPRVRAFFDEVRRPILGDVARQAYASARDALARKDHAAAAAGFGQVVRVIDEIEHSAGGPLAELRTLAVEFKDLADMAVAAAAAEARARAEAEERQREIEAARATSEAAAAVTSAGAPGSATAPVPDPDHIYTDDDAGIGRPQVISRAVPQWMPGPGVDSGRVFSGVIEVVIDRDGRVESPVMRESVHPLYDPILLRATRAWRFTPATKDGVPVRYRYRLGVKVGG